MARTFASSAAADLIFDWEGLNGQGHPVRGQLRARGENQVKAMLRRQGVQPLKVTRHAAFTGRPIKSRDIALFTRQLATMMHAGVPLLQCFDVLGRGHSNLRLARLLNDIRADVETGTALSAAFARYPEQFDAFYCNLVSAGEAAGLLDVLLDRLALYMEKSQTLKGKVKSALTYPAAVLLVACVVVGLIMVFVVPAFKTVFASFGADLPGPTLLVLAISEFMLAYGWLVLGAGLGALALFRHFWRKSDRLQTAVDHAVLKLPVFGMLLRQACIARWTRTLATIFAAGVPLVEALDSVGGTAGNAVYAQATTRIQQDVAMGVSLNAAMSRADVFPSMVLQMCAIGEDSGTLDHMLGKAADFFEAEVDQKVATLASLIEPLIIVTLGAVIGGIVVSIYLPIFNLGQVI